MLLLLSRCFLSALEVRLMAMVSVLYNNPSKCFNRKNGKNYTFSEATEMLDKKLENLGVQYQRQYDLLKGVIEADKKKYSNLSKDNLSDKEIIDSNGF